MAASASTVSGLAGASLASRPAFSTSFTRGSRVSARNPLMSRNLERNGRITCMTFPRDWLRRDLSVIGFGLIGWMGPSSVPAIGQELAHFPTPPPVTSQFWLWLVTWHLGLFIVLTFGQIGFKGRTEDYFEK